MPPLPKGRGTVAVWRGGGILKNKSGGKFRRFFVFLPHQHFYFTTGGGKGQYSAGNFYEKHNNKFIIP